MKPNEPRFKKISEAYYHKNWRDFIKLKRKKTNSIFRGQSNFEGKLPLESIWKLSPSFKRENQTVQFEFIFEAVKKVLNNRNKYPALKIFRNKNLSYIEVLQYFQHYGIVTPLIDFTFDYKIALYFAIKDICRYGASRCTYEYDGKSYITIFEIDLDELKKIGICDYMELKNNMASCNYKNINIEEEILRTQCFFISNPSIIVNRNAKKQKAAFIYCLEDDLEELLYRYLETFPLQENSIKPLKIHYISYNEIYPYVANQDYFEIYKYLIKRKKAGVFLFNDLQGVKYDIMNRNFINLLFS